MPPTPAPGSTPGSIEPTIDIRMTRTVKEAGPPFRAGYEMRVTRKELADLKVPDDAYDVIERCKGLPPATNPEVKAKAQASK